MPGLLGCPIVLSLCVRTGDENGPLPPSEVFEVVNAASPGFRRTVPSPTNNGVPGQIQRPSGKTRTGIRFHEGTRSQGCVVVCDRETEAMLRDTVDQNDATGGTRLIIFEVQCDQPVPGC